MAPRKFVILNNKNLAISNGSTGFARQAFNQSDISPTQTVTFTTTNPCVAVVDSDEKRTQWDLNSKRVWYTDTTVEIDLIDIFYAKGMIITEATLRTNEGIYTRARTEDTDSGYGWFNESLTPPYLYTKAESPDPGDKAYYSATTVGTNATITEVTRPIVQPIGDASTTWDAIFTVSQSDSGSTVSGIAYEVWN